MAKKTKTTSPRLPALLLILALVVVWAGYTLQKTSQSLPKDTAGNVIKTPSPGDAAKSALSTPTPVPTSSGSTKPLTTSSSNASYILAFSVSSRGNGQYAATTLSGGANCSITLAPSAGSPVTKTGPVISTGSTLSCDFGGIIEVSGHGSAKLTVLGADGKIDTKETTF
jgi:hypothetical protein